MTPYRVEPYEELYCSHGVPRERHCINCSAAQGGPNPKAPEYHRANGQRVEDPPDAVAANPFDGLLVTGNAVLELPDVKWSIEGVVPAGALVVTYGPPKHGKSLVTGAQGLSVATGLPWAPLPDRMWGNGFEVDAGPVIYVVGEGVGGLSRRVRAWLDHHGRSDVGEMHWLKGAVNLTSALEVEQFIAVAKRIGPKQMFFDTLARCSLGAEENSARDVGIVVAALDRIREATGATCHVVHHSGKDLTKGLRGSSALLGAADAVFEVTRAGRLVTWRCTAMKDAEEPRPITFRMVQVGDSIALEPEGAAAAAVPDSVWQVRTALADVALDDGATNTAWMAGSDVSERSFYRAKKWLVDNGHAEQIGTGRGARYVAVKDPE